MFRVASALGLAFLVCQPAFADGDDLSIGSATTIGITCRRRATSSRSCSRPIAASSSSMASASPE